MDRPPSRQVDPCRQVNISPSSCRRCAAGAELKLAARVNDTCRCGGRDPADPNADAALPGSYDIRRRPREAGDRRVVVTISDRLGFQSTPARSGRHGCSDGTCLWLHVSIHARPKRATRCRAPRESTRGRFNPQPREAGDKTAAAAISSVSLFQSAPEAGDIPVGKATIPPLRFQSAPARSGRHSRMGVWQ